MNIFRKLFERQADPAHSEAAQVKPSPSELLQAMSVRPSPARIESEHRAQAEILATLESRMVDSGLFLAEKIPQLMHKIRENSAPFQGPNTSAAFAGETFLSAEENRALGLNARMKYSHEFIACCSPAILSSVEPKGALHDMHLDIYHRVNREHRLAEIQHLGIDKVRISTSGTGQECEQVRQLKGVYKLEAVPSLPLPGCNSAVCQCFYMAVIDGF